MKRSSKYLSSCGAVLAFAGSVVPALAQDQADQVSVQQSDANEPNANDDIVVTAQKRSESIQAVPIAISAVTGEGLERSGISNLEGIQSAVPSLSIGQTTGAARIALRGVGSENLGTGAEGSIAFHVNGIFMARTAAALSAFFDVERIEILRGPQGTLYGRNATAGAINVITRRPTDSPEGYMNLTLGNYDTVKIEGAVSGPLVEDKVLARFAYLVDYHAGYGKNIMSGRDIDNAMRQSVRGTLEFRPTDSVTLIVTGDYHHEDDQNYAYHYFGRAGVTAAGVPVTPTGLRYGGIVASDRSDIASESEPVNKRDFWGVTGDLTIDLGFGDLRSLTAYRSTDYLSGTDLDQTSAAIASPLIQYEYSRQFTQELQLTGSSSSLQWLVGAYYFHENDRARIALPVSTFSVGAPAPGTLMQGIDGRGTLVTKAAAAFGQITYEVAPALRLTLGARYSWERKSVDNASQFDLVRPYREDNAFLPTTFQVESTSFEAFTPRASIDYKLDENTLIYASFSKGFKSGNYKVGGPQKVINPEKITAYEAGVKTTVGDGLLRLNLAGFYYDYTDLQVGKVIGATLGLENAANARVYGIELETRLRPAPNFELNATASWLHARFIDYVSIDPARPRGDGVTTENGLPAFDLGGNTLSQAPNFTASGGGEYRLDLSDHQLTLRSEVAWTDRVYFSPFNVPEVSQPAKTKINAFVTFAPNDEAWSVTLFAKNIGGKRFIQNAYVNSSLVGFTVTGGLEEPGLYGVTTRMRF